MAGRFFAAASAANAAKYQRLKQTDEDDDAAFELDKYENDQAIVDEPEEDADAAGDGRDKRKTRGNGTGVLDNDDEEELVAMPLSIDFTQDTTSNQRTQMAWVRTSLGMISLGLSIMHIFTKESEVLALVMILLGVVYGFVSSIRFFMFFQFNETGKFRTNSFMVSITSAVTLLAMVVLLLIMYFDNPGNKDTSGSNPSVTPTPPRVDG